MAESETLTEVDVQQVYGDFLIVTDDGAEWTIRTRNDNSTVVNVSGGTEAFLFEDMFMLSRVIRPGLSMRLGVPGPTRTLTTAAVRTIEPMPS